MLIEDCSADPWWVPTSLFPLPQLYHKCSSCKPSLCFQLHNHQLHIQIWLLVAQKTIKMHKTNVRCLVSYQVVAEVSSNPLQSKGYPHQSNLNHHQSEPWLMILWISLAQRMTQYSKKASWPESKNKEGL